VPRPKPRPKRGTPPWLEPLDENEAHIWLQDMWGSVAALYRSYPTAFAHLPEGWWRDAQLMELLCCMATWRVNIDVASEDPREEFSFHNGLQQIAHLLGQAPGGGRRFKIGRMPVTGAAHGSNRGCRVHQAHRRRTPMEDWSLYMCPGCRVARSQRSFRMTTLVACLLASKRAEATAIWYPRVVPAPLLSNLPATMK
jgi:hypothetical protein